MTKKILSLIATAMLSLSVTSCIEEYSPQSDTVTKEQVFNSPTAFQSAVDAITAFFAESSLMEEIVIHTLTILVFPHFICNVM